MNVNLDLIDTSKYRLNSSAINELKMRDKMKKAPVQVEQVDEISESNVTGDTEEKKFLGMPRAVGITVAVVGGLALIVGGMAIIKKMNNK